MGFLRGIFVPTNSRRLNELTGFLLCVFALLLFLALVSYSPLDPSFNSASVLTETHAARNWIGVVGASISDLLLQFFGITPGQPNAHLVSSPNYHTAVTIFGGSALHMGHTLVCLDAWDSEQALALVERYRVTHAHGPDALQADAVAARRDQELL